MEDRIKARKLLEQYEQVPFRALERALKGRGISHAYLFHGPEGTLKSELALLLAQTLLCGRTDGLIREEEASEREKNLCRRAAEGACPDLIRLSGYEKKAIDKQSVDDLQEAFARKPLECPNQVYIMEHCENTSIAAMNSILKFLEEPGENVYAVLTADNIGRVLPTIRSRCVILPFVSLPQETYIRLAEEDGTDPEDAYFMARIRHMTSGHADFAVTPVWQTARAMFRQFLGIDADPRMLLVDYDCRYKASAKGGKGIGVSEKEEEIDVLILFFSFLIMLSEDGLTGENSGVAWYDEAVRKEAGRRRPADMMRIASEQRDKCNKTNDLGLILAEGLLRLEDTLK